jgi:hypothetical protein
MRQNSLKSGKKNVSCNEQCVQLSVKYFRPYWVTFREKKE